METGSILNDVPAIVTSTVISYILCCYACRHKAVILGGVEHHLAFSGINISNSSILLIRDKFGSSDAYVVTS